MSPQADETRTQGLFRRNVPAVSRWLEAAFVTVCVVAAGAWYRPQDPFYIDHVFAWPVLAPLLVGLRYGFFMALMSCLSILAAMGMYWRSEQLGMGAFPWVWAAGVLAVGLLAGEFRDYWGRKLEKLEAANSYGLQRLEEFTRSFYLLKVSHDRLEQRLAGSSGSLREALRRLYNEISHSPSGGLDQQNADGMLQLLIRYGQLQVAAIYAVDSGKLQPTPLATTGDYKALKENDPLISHALEEQTLVSVQTEFRDHLKRLDTDLLAAVPFLDSSGNMIALCAIQAMPFFSFQDRILRLIAILSGHMADLVQQRSVVGSQGDPDWQNLQYQMRRAGLDAEHFDLRASMIAFHCPVGFAGVLEDRVLRLRRGLDVIATVSHGTGVLTVLLMPLTDELGQSGYLQRLEDDIRQHTGSRLGDEVTYQTHVIETIASAEAWLAQQQDRDVSEGMA